jgi:predicted DNA-binding transcriptional regulator AlpA
MDNEPFMTTADVCAWRKRSRASTFNDIKAGLIPRPFKIGRHNRWYAWQIKGAAVPDNDKAAILGMVQKKQARRVSCRPMPNNDGPDEAA